MLSDPEPTDLHGIRPGEPIRRIRQKDIRGKEVGQTSREQRRKRNRRGKEFSATLDRTPSCELPFCLATRAFATGQISIVMRCRGTGFAMVYPPGDSRP